MASKDPYVRFNVFAAECPTTKLKLSELINYFGTSLNDHFIDVLWILDIDRSALRNTANFYW